MSLALSGADAAHLVAAAGVVTARVGEPPGGDGG